MDGEIIAGAGQVTIDDILIVNTEGKVVDLKTFMVEFVLYEDLFSPCLTAKILISDGTDLISTLPIRGNELVIMKCRTPTFSDNPREVIEKQFRVYSIENRINNNDTQSMYTLMLISYEGYADQLNTVSRSYDGRTDEIVSNLYYSYIESDKRFDKPGVKTPLTISDTPHASKIKYTSNYWTPFKNMNFISKRVRGNKLKGSDYIFFESNKGFYFASIEALTSLQNTIGVLDDYVYEPVEGMIPRRSDEKKYFGNILPEAFTKISAISMPKTVDIIEGANAGYFANAIYGYDLTTKKLTESVFDYVEGAKEFVRTSPGVPIPKDVKSNPFMHTEFVTFNTSLHNSYGTTDEKELPSGHPAQYVTDRKHFRKSYLNGLDHMKFEINIPGRTDIEVGQLININYVSPRSKTDQDDADTVLDPYLSGPYIITALKHIITFDKHVITAEVVKNGLNFDLSI